MNDTELIDWVERGGHRVIPGLASVDRDQWLVFHGLGAFCAFAKGPSWRTAVEAATKVDKDTADA
jgi:hypothetical protein